MNQLFPAVSYVIIKMTLSVNQKTKDSKNIYLF